MSPLYVVTGSRNYPDEVLVRSWGRNLPADAILLEGGARGVDTWAANGFLLTHPFGQLWERPVTDAEWQAHGRGAGHRRNRMMAEEAFQYRVAGGQVFVTAFLFQGSKGTSGMIEACLERLFSVQIKTPGIDIWEELKP